MSGSCRAPRPLRHASVQWRPPMQYRKSVPDSLDRVDDHRRPQPSGAADNGGGRLSYPTTGALADRGVVGGGMAGGWVTYGAATGG